MRFWGSILTTVAATVAMVDSSGAAMAASFSGHWPVTVAHSQRSNGTFCLTLFDNGTSRFPHSGSASLEEGGQRLFGTFQVINELLVATIEQPGGSGQNAGLVFVASANNGNIGSGIYEQVYGGQDF